MIEDKEISFDKEAENHLKSTVCHLEQDIEASEHVIGRKRDRLDENEVEIREFETANKKKRLEFPRENTSKVKKISKRLFLKWKRSRRSQKGKGQGDYRIDRGAEKAVYDVLHEQEKSTLSKVLFLNFFFKHFLQIIIL